MKGYEPFIPERKIGGNAPSPSYRIPPPPPRQSWGDQTEDDPFMVFVRGNDQDDFSRCHRQKRKRTDGGGFWGSFRRVCEVILALQLSEVLHALVSYLIEKLCT